MTSRRSLLLGLVGVGVLILIALLALEVRDSPATEVDEAKLKEAQANYRRAQAAAERARPGLTESAPVLPPRPVAEDDIEVPEPAPERNMPLERRDPPRLRLNPAAASDMAQPVGVTATGDGEGGSLKGAMDGVNHLYDRADYEGARDAAIKVLDEDPKQVRMLRVVVSSSCIMGDQDIASKYFDMLERERDRRQMARRCSRYGVELGE